MLSYAHGASDRPLLGETIGQNLKRTIERVPDADALISCHQGMRYTYAEFGEPSSIWPAGCGGLGCARATAPACGAPTGRSGHWSSTPRPRWE